MTGLGSLPGTVSQATGVNGDGSILVGLLDSQAFRWTASGGITGLGFLPGGNFSNATSVSSDGSIVVGASGNFRTQAFRWTASTGMVGLGFLPTDNFSGAGRISGDGSVVVGSSENLPLAGPLTHSEAFRWTAATGMIGLGFLPGYQFSAASGTNSDGSVVVGTAQSPPGAGNLQAFRWTAATGMVGLGFLPGQIASRAQATNADGSVIVGSSIDNGGTDHVARWTSSTGIQSVQDILTAHHVNLAGWTLLDGIDISADGTTMVGSALDPSGHFQGFRVQVPVDAFALLDLSGSNRSIGSLIWSGRVTNSGTTPATLTVGSDNSNTTFDGVIEDGVATTALAKVGIGTTILTSANTYTGATTVDGGTLVVNGSIANSTVTVNNGGVLVGNGIVGNTFIDGGMFAPGNGTPGSSMTVSGNLAFQSGAIYLIQINPATSSFANVTGTATPGGATVDAFWANGSYVSKKYTILTATGGVNGTFGSLANTNLPANFSTSLSYDANHAFLDLTLNFTPPPSGPNFGSGLNGNQQNVANALVNFFNSTGSIPLVFGTLSPAGLTQVSGELASGTQQTTFDAMNLFMSLLTDPFMDRSGNGADGTGATPFAEEIDTANAYAARDPSRSKSERDAHAAIYRKAPLAAPFVPSWSVWAAGYGGSQTTDGNVTLGSNTATSRIAGTAVGADYRFLPDTIAGIALAGGGTSFSIANALGTGRSDLFQAGAYVRHTQGPAYISAALAYGWQDITTNRTVTIAGIDQLQARFNANAWSGRAEGGYRFATPWMGVTPYAAAQFTTFDLPAYAEQAISGANTFALAYAAKSVTDTRSELGIRTDKSWAMQGGILTLRGRFAWAHDFDPDRNIAATFQALPGASFVVNGAGQAHDSALTTASAEVKWMNGWSAAATFEGEFSDVTRSYAGKGVVRCSW
jgi:autotransporter-associated beta strand protein